MRLEYRRKVGIGRLAWAARCRDKVITVYHGDAVETHSDWFVEGIWNGPFDEGGFDRTSLVCGSGGRARQGHIAFVSSGNPLDRLWQWSGSDGLWISNSLALILAITGTRLVDDYSRYSADIMTICHGLGRYVEKIPVNSGKLEVVYVDNLVYDGQAVRRAPKPLNLPDFPEFAAYWRFLRSTTSAMAANMSAPNRSTPLAARVPLSSGYDSPAVAAITKGIIPSVAVSLSTAWNPGWGRAPDDCGEAVARDLGLPVEIRERNECFHDEVAFWSVCGKGGDLFWSLLGGADSDTVTVFFTGIYGDKVWDRQSHDGVAVFYRGEVPSGPDMTGACLSEYRVQHGIIQCPVPMWAVSSYRQILAISQSSEMRPWTLNTRYDRPIARRICETAGVAREHFGITKRWPAWTYLWAPASTTHRRDFFVYLARNGHSQVAPRFGRSFFSLNKVSQWVIRRTPFVRGYAKKLDYPMRPDYEPLFRWALDRMIQRFEVAL
jgi:hypothetical protein